jgi:hypothetical protein
VSHVDTYSNLAVRRRDVLLVRAWWDAMMTTMNRRRQHRDRRAKPDSDIASVFKIGLHTALAMFFLAVLLCMLVLGQPFIDATFGFLWR